MGFVIENLNPEALWIVRLQNLNTEHCKGDPFIGLLSLSVC